MKIDNRHERYFKTKADTVGNILDTLSRPDDRLWPRDTWPPMLFDTGLQPGAKGGHGMVRYEVEEYAAGRRAIFRFDGTGLTAGLDGRHYFEIIPRNSYAILRHVIDADCDFKAWLKWKILIEPLHDALLEDALDRAESALNGCIKRPAHWSVRVKILRKILAEKRRRAALKRA
ncbi:MAG: hypothetical protein CSYNP_01067 [Syntrophus sp. SKADARSKE-3]|nr:hypothetical protein [Syntrophus sp. SKADARSKE-3]